MLFEVFKFEILYRARRADTYIYFFILFIFSVVAVDFIYEGNLEPLKRNAPLVIARTMGIVSALFMVIISMVMGVAILRDFDHGMESLIFINPIKKIDYLGGRFLGSFATLIFIFSGLLFGMVLGDFMPWHEVDSKLPFTFKHYLHPFFNLVLPTLFFGGAIFFVSGALSRQLIIVYIQGFLFLMAYLLAMNLALNSEDLFITGLLEPFTFQTVRIVTRFWTVIERNSAMIPMEGVLLYNRITWMCMGIMALVIGYYRFSFELVRTKKSKKQIKATADAMALATRDSTSINIPTFTHAGSLKTSAQQLAQQALFTFKWIVKEIPFLVIVICGICILLISSINLGNTFGVDSYPKTYVIVGELVELTIIFFLSIIVFYSGELVWKERDTDMEGIYDALPVSDLVSLAGKLLGLVFAFVVLILAMIGSGILFQTFKGYNHYELGVYFKGFFMEIFPFFLLLTLVCFFFQALLNHKFMAHLATVLFLGTCVILPRVLGYDHGLYVFGGSDLGTYSDMNDYGHFVEPYFWFKVYWLAFSTILFIIAVVLIVRGSETNISTRWSLSKQRFTRPLKQFGSVALVIFMLSGSYIFYNTNIINEYTTRATQEEYQASYEKKLKRFEHLAQPTIVDVDLVLDLYPNDRNYSLYGNYILVNKHNVPIPEIHIQKLPNHQVAMEYFSLSGGATIDGTYTEYGYRIYELTTPLMPGDSINLQFQQTYTSQGFSESDDTDVVYNGTFLDNFHFPSLGYNRDIELEGAKSRRRNGLGEKIRRAKIDDPIAVLEGRSSADGEEINFRIVVSTDSGQTAIAPGYLLAKWEEDNRTYFHYEMDKSMSNFYAIVSGRYEIYEEQWISPDDSLEKPVNLEIYYHQGHEYNLDRMANGMKKSLEYYGRNFAPYQYRLMRILESPIYRNNAQSFPNTITFSEGIGFIMNIDDQADVDMAFFITAHEMAHQWWGHQINPANVQGMSMISEALAQYSALMLFRDEYPEEKVHELLKMHKKRYLKGRSKERAQEMPLALVESGQEYIHYGKGLVNLHALQDYISEDSVNLALRRFVKDWDSFTGRLKKQTERYPTTKDLLGYFRSVTPDSLQYVIKDLFETITLYELVTEEATFENISDEQFVVHLSIDALKYRIDSLGREESIEINDWVDVGVYAQRTDNKNELVYLKKHKIANRFTDLEIKVNQRPHLAGIDPFNKLIDRNVSNNVKVVEAIP